jgi:hypothetical protein
MRRLTPIAFVGVLALVTIGAALIGRSEVPAGRWRLLKGQIWRPTGGIAEFAKEISADYLRLSVSARAAR